MLAIPAHLTSELSRLGLDLQNWSPNDESVAERQNVAEALALAVHLYNRLMRHHQEWTDRVHAKLEPFTMERALEFERGFHGWVAAARSLHQRVKVLEKEGHFLDLAWELSLAIQRCPYDGISVEELVSNASELEQGKGISMEELRDEIRRKAGVTGR